MTSKRTTTGDEAGVKNSERDETGRFLPGTTPNPGGLTREQRRLRSAFLEDAPFAVSLAKAWMRGFDLDEFGQRKEAEVSDDLRKFGLQTVLDRAIGKAPKASELPPGPIEPQSPSNSSASDSLATIREVISQHVAAVAAQHADGGLSPESAKELGGLGRMLGEILESEERAKALSGLRGKSTPDLLRAILHEGGAPLLREALAEFDRNAEAPSNG